MRTVPIYRRLTEFAFLAVFSAVVLAQSVTGFITGKVTDQRGNRIAGAMATVSNPQTRTRKKASTKDDGYFTIGGLHPGQYILTVEKPGYKIFEKTVNLDTMGKVNAGPISLSPSDDNDRKELPPGDEFGVTVEVTLFPEEVKQNALGETPNEVPPGGGGALTGPAGNAGTADNQAGRKPGGGADQVILQSLSGERSELITNNQLINLALNGRDTIEFLKLVPGVFSEFNGQVSNPGGLDRFFINGTRGNQHEPAIDGVSNIDTATNALRHVTINPDAISEIKVLTSNYQAEIGRSAGGFIQIATKAGTVNFHGGGRYFNRNEGLNANNYFNNSSGLTRPLYRYTDLGYDIGGPVYLPRFGSGGRPWKKVENLLFYFNQEIYRQTIPNVPRFIRVPTQAERLGDFSRTEDATGTVVSLVDPDCASGAAIPCIAGNIIPLSRLSRNGTAILNLFPLPNLKPSAANGFANYVSQASTEYPRQEIISRVDYKIKDSTFVNGKAIVNLDRQSLPFGLPGNVNSANPARIDPTNNPFAQNFDGWNLLFERPGYNYGVTLSHAFNDTLSNEVIVGLSGNFIDIAPEPGKATRSVAGLDFPQLFPAANPDGYIPNLLFGIAVRGTNTRGPNTTYNGLPLKSRNYVITVIDNLTKVWGSHLLKGGFFIEDSRRRQTSTGLNNSTISFIGPAKDTGNTFANALLGNYQSYQQSEKFYNATYDYKNVEWYLQDLWRVSDRLAIDLGARFSWYQPQYDTGRLAAFFNPALYDQSRKVRLFEPVLVSGSRRAIDPLNRPQIPTLQNTLAETYIGRIVLDPANLANMANGFAAAGSGYPAGGLDDRGGMVAPRIGFAFDLIGDSKNIVRGGFGIFYDRLQGRIINDMLNNPPSAGLTRDIRNGRLDSLDTSQTIINPPRVFGMDRNGKVPAVYSFSLSYQRDIGFKTMLDVAYVGTLSRHLTQARNINSIPYGDTFRLQNQDPTRFPNGVIPCATADPSSCAEPGLFKYYQDAGLKFSGRLAKPVELLRPYPGFEDIRFYEFGGSSNYHSLQVSARRRFSSNLTMSVAYTWSKAMTTANDDLEVTPPNNVRDYNYRLASFDRTHVFAASYVYLLPGAGRLFGSWRRLGSLVLDGWQVSGITQFISGQPSEIGDGLLGSDLTGLGSSTNIRLAGSYTDGVRFFLNGLPQPGSGEMIINTDAFVLPRPGNTGPWPRTYLRGPGVNNHDISIFKNFQLDSKGRMLQLRVELFNAFNHTQFSDINKAGPNFGLDADDPYFFFSTRAGILRYYLSGRKEVFPQTTTNAPLGRFFGEYNNARDPRIIQIGAKFYF